MRTIVSLCLACCLASQAPGAVIGKPKKPYRDLPDDERREPACRFGLIDYLPKASKPRDLVRGLDTVFRDVVEPALRRDEQRRGPRPLT